MEKMETMTDFIWGGGGGSKITVVTIAMNLLFRRKVMTNLDPMLKNRYHFVTKVCIVKAMLFPVVMYRCESWTIKMAVKVKGTQSCPTLCDPMDYTVHGILQARILEWVAFSAEHQRIDAFKLRCWRRLLRVP